MNDLQIFQSEQFGEVRRVITGDNQFWWVAADVCRALGIKEHRKATARLDEDEKGVRSIPSLGGNQNTTIVNESGLYSLALRSRKPEAKAFKRWITHEVIPSIRRTGSYGVSDNSLSDSIAKMAEAITYLSQRMEQMENKISQPAALPSRFEAAKAMEKKRWTRLANKKLDLITEIVDFSRNQILHMAYTYVEQCHNVDLNEERLRYMEETGAEGTVIETIYANDAYRADFEYALNYYLPESCQAW